MMSSMLITLSGLTIIGFSWLFGILCTYSLYRFYELKRNNAYEMIFIKRRGNLVVTYTKCGIFILLIGYPSGMLLHWGFDFMTPITTDTRCATYIILEMIHLIDIFIFYLGATLILLRWWMIYYDIQFSIGGLNLEWKQCITKSKAALHNDKWYIQHRNTLGNASYMRKKAVIVIASIALFSTVMHALFTLFEIVDLDLAPFISPILVLIQFIILIIIWHKMPFFDDKIHLYKEFRIVAFFWIVITCVYGCSAIVNRVAHEHDVNIMLSCFGHFCAVFMCFIVPFMSTFWVLKYIKTDRVSVTSEPDELEDIFNDTDKLNQFMQHLIKEFSMECLLSVIEFQQYKQAAMNVFDLDIKEHFATVTYSHEHVPQSDIVFDDTNASEEDVKSAFKRKAYKLYQKYVEPRSPFELNISAQRRYKLIEYMEHYDQWMNGDNSITESALVNIFDEINHEMVQLLNCSIMSMCMTK
eukprot:502394_1